jgi:hypothetical protein
MAMILDFRSRNARPEAREPAEASGAEIIIFPGVRRERQTEAAPKAARRKKAPKRDRLELPD